jgi:hypothetical protein
MNLFATLACVYALGVLTILTGQAIDNHYEPIYKTNLAKYEIELNRCLDYPKGNIRDCHQVAIYKSKTCVTGCE